MNKYFIKIFFAGFGMTFLLLGSCKKNNVVVEQDVVPPTYAKFNVIKSPVYETDSTAFYYVNNTGESFKLAVGLTTVSDKDRTVNFSYSSNSAVQGIQYSAPNSITIPAGSALDTLEINGIFAGIGLGVTDTLTIQITGTDEVPMSPYKNKFRLYMLKSCPVVLTDLEGIYNNTFDNLGTYGPYITTVTPGSIVLTSATSGTFTIENIWDPGVPVITTVNADWTADPDHPVISIADQEFFGPADIWIRGTATASSFSPCDQTIKLYYTLYYHTSGADFAADQETIMTR